MCICIYIYIYIYIYIVSSCGVLSIEKSNSVWLSSEIPRVIQLLLWIFCSYKSRTSATGQTSYYLCKGFRCDVEKWLLFWVPKSTYVGNKRQFHEILDLPYDRSIASYTTNLQRVRSFASSFNLQYPPISLRTFSSCLRLLPRLPATSTLHSTFP